MKGHRGDIDLSAQFRQAMHSHARGRNQAVAPGSTVVQHRVSTSWDMGSLTSDTSRGAAQRRLAWSCLRGRAEASHGPPAVSPARRQAPAISQEPQVLTAAAGLWSWSSIDEKDGTSSAVASLGS
jgi:hypothetical protein